jgi:hypothetical protein
MKKLALTLSVMLLSITAFSQSANKNIEQSKTMVIAGPYTDSDMMKYSGLELATYTRHHNTGVRFIAAGCAFSLLGATVLADPGPNVAFTAVGCIVSTIGIIYTLEAPKHIKNAGLILSGNGVGIKIKL